MIYFFLLWVTSTLHPSDLTLSGILEPTAAHKSEALPTPGLMESLNGLGLTLKTRPTTLPTFRLFLLQTLLATESKMIVPRPSTTPPTSTHLPSASVGAPWPWPLPRAGVASATTGLRDDVGCI